MAVVNCSLVIACFLQFKINFQTSSFYLTLKYLLNHAVHYEVTQCAMAQRLRWQLLSYLRYEVGRTALLDVAWCHQGRAVHLGSLVLQLLPHGRGEKDKCCPGTFGPVQLL